MLQPVPGDSAFSALPANSTALARVVACAQAGDHAAFETLYWHYNRPIWNRLMYLVGNREAAEELHQETFIRAWINLPKMKGDLQFGAWLYRIAANTAIDYLRHAQKFEFFPLPEDESEGYSTTEHMSIKGPEEYLCEKDHFERALAQVSRKFRICLLLQDQWGFSQREIAKLLGITISCVGSYICRGREQFRKAHRNLASKSEMTDKGERQ